ncbi:MAG: trehalose-phosphatase [Hymenobacter sp.]
MPVDFIAEHGVWLRPAGGEWELFQQLRNDWMRELRPVLELYVARTAGSFIEEKDYSLVWHYRRAGADLGEVRARELLSHLSFMTANTELQVMEGNKVLEIKAAGINKGNAAARWLAKYPADFVLALGDDRTDEDTFRALPRGVHHPRGHRRALAGALPHRRARGGAASCCAGCWCRRECFHRSRRRGFRRRGAEEISSAPLLRNPLRLPSVKTPYPTKSVCPAS